MDFFKFISDIVNILKTTSYVSVFTIVLICIWLVGKSLPDIITIIDKMRLKRFL
ncbi:MAG: hypothetical protein ABH873_08565 [Candidatus Firestonebacteria bacterium]